MDLWVFNATKKNLKFKYRFPEIPGVKTAIIPIGGQTCLHKPGLNQAEVDALAAQLEAAYGAVPSTQAARVRGRVNVFYSIDRPVKPGAIEAAVEHNIDVLTEEGAELRKQAAVAIHSALADKEAESRFGRGNLRETHVEIVEETRRGETPQINERVEVVREGEGAAPSRRGRPKKGS
jgi:hypothetical protein